MEEIELTVMSRTPAADQALLELLKEFEAETGVHLHVNFLDWLTARAELNRAAIYHRGPDISEVGSTWVPDLANMNALHSLDGRDMEKIGRPEEFIRAGWSTSQFPGGPEIWAVPWHAETYVIHYRRDLLEKAGVDPATAFGSHADLEVTAKKLARAGVDVPVELTLQTDRYGTLHVLASWIWAHGGAILSADSKRVLLDQPQVMEALRGYFGLLGHISPPGRQWMLKKTTSLFLLGQSAVTFGTMRLASPAETVPPEVKENWRWAALPQPCFVGGSNLVIWKHTRNKCAAVRLIEFFGRAPVQARVNQVMASLPPRLGALAMPPYSQDPMLKVMSAAIQSGRTYSPLYLWGLVEDKLVALLIKIGTELLHRPDADADRIIRDEVGVVANRLNLTLG